MNVVLYDPEPFRNDYFSIMFARPLLAYQNGIRRIDSLDTAKDASVLILTDHLSEERIQKLKNNNCRIIGFNVTDSSYFSESIRHCPSLHLIDRIFMVSGIPIRNHCQDFRITPDFEIEMFDYPFLPEHEWIVFQRMHKNGQLLSIPYVPWQPIPDYPWTPFSNRSQKVLLRGGGHSRRFILGLFLMRAGLLDINSGMMLGFYFDENMNPAFKFCDNCRSDYRNRNKTAPYQPGHDASHCTSPAYSGEGKWDLSNLGFWNNRCPRSFYWMAEQFQKRYGPLDMVAVETLLNGKWIHDNDHQKMLSRILFTSDLKWIHSIYAPQRFWQGAAAGCINILPERTNDQVFFPEIKDGEHFITFREEMDFIDLDFFGRVDEALYSEVSGNAKRVYDQWIRPSTYALNTNLMDHILKMV